MIVKLDNIDYNMVITDKAIVETDKNRKKTVKQTQTEEEHK